MDEKLVGLQHFFGVDLRLKEEMIKMSPPIDIQYLNEQSLCDYSDNMDKALRYIFCELKCISFHIFGPNALAILTRICELESLIKHEFYLCGLDPNKLREFYKKFISSMDIEFLNLVKEKCVGYALCEPNLVNKAVSINELLHFFHSFVMNNEAILQSVALINKKTNLYNYPINLRGNDIPLFSEIFNQFPADLDVGHTDMVAIDENKLVMMVRDRGHALTIEITINGNMARVEYFIPKLCNISMVNKLPGIINKVNEDSIGATGAFEVPVDSLKYSLFDFISKVPTDDDIELQNYRL